MRNKHSKIFGLVLALVVLIACSSSGIVYAAGEEPEENQVENAQTLDSGDMVMGEDASLTVDEEEDTKSTEASEEGIVTQSEGNQVIYRLYSNVNGEHLYTTDANEVRILCANHFWVYEGSAWFAPTSGTPVYRLYNNGLQNHLYTTDTNEVNVLTTSHGWQMDNNGNPLFYSGGDVDIYRLYNKELRGLHLWTTDNNEYNVLPGHGWTQEGIALKGVAKGSSSYEFPRGDATIENVGSQRTIEADVTMSGSGTGYHAKLVANTRTSAVSYGLQYDSAAEAPYTGKTSLLVENVSSNNTGGQKYTRLGYGSIGMKYHLMMTVQNDGRCDFYLNGVWSGSVTNPQLANTTVYLRVEGSARRNEDAVSATFENIKMKQGGTYTGKVYGVSKHYETNAGMKVDDSQYPASQKIMVSGTIVGLADNQDWDSAFKHVSGIAQFYER